MTKLLCCVMVSVALASCTDEPPVASSTPTPIGTVASVVHDPDGLCDNEGFAVLDETKRTEGELTGDVDGDGTDDEIYIVHDPAAETRCQSFLVADTAGTLYSAPANPTDISSSLQVPSLNSLAEVGGEPGSEIVVNVEAGASTQFVSLFTLTDRGLEQMTIEGRGAGPFATEDDVFAFGGSVGHLDAVTCIASDIVIVSSALPTGARAQRYEVERRFFLVEGATLRLDRGSIEHHTTEGLELNQFPEFERSPFVGCD